MTFKFTIKNVINPLSEVQVKGKVITVYLRCKTHEDKKLQLLRSCINTEPVGAGGSKIVLVDGRASEHKALHTNEDEKSIMHFHFKHEFEISSAKDILDFLNNILQPLYEKYPGAEKINDKALFAQFEEYQQKEASEKASINEAGITTSNINILTNNAATLFSGNAEIAESTLKLPPSTLFL